VTAFVTVPRRQTIASQLFGPLDVDADQVITFPSGLLGFGAQQHYVLLPAAEQGVYWMQSCDEARLVFLLVDPAALVPGYVEHVRGLYAEAGARPDSLAVLCIATLPRVRSHASTCNLLGPLLINLTRQEGAQRVLAEGAFSARHPVDLASCVGGDSSPGPSGR
jgi:flagellar assembly factor FliW